MPVETARWDKDGIQEQQCTLAGLAFPFSDSSLASHELNLHRTTWTATMIRCITLYIHAIIEIDQKKVTQLISYTPFQGMK